MAFETYSAMVLEDINAAKDVYVRDRELGLTELISVSSQGIQADGFCDVAEITPDGRWVSFYTASTTLVLEDTNNQEDVFVRDRWTGETFRVSVSSSGGESNGQSNAGALSADGRFVAFQSWGSNLVPNDTNGTLDVFVHDRADGSTTCISVDPQGNPAEGGSSSTVISADGRFVAFYSLSSSIAPCVFGGPIGDSYVLDRSTGAFSCISLTPSGSPANFGSFVTGISADGRYVVFDSEATDLVSGDTNNDPDVFVRDMVLGVTTRVSVSTSGGQGTEASERGRISANGRFVAFRSSSILVAGDTIDWDIYVHDRWLDTTTLVSQSTSGANANSQCSLPNISPDGTCVAFVSNATNLISGGDTNGTQGDVMVRECPPAGPFVYCAAKMNSQGCIPSILSSGAPSSTSTLPFDIAAVGVLNHRPGLLIYSTTGQNLVPFSGGFLCIAPPIERTPVQISSGSQPPILDCTGEYHFDFNAWIQSGQDPALVAGQSVWAQYWHRDPGFAPPDAVGLTDAVEFTIL